MARHNRRQNNTQPAQSTSSTPFTYQPISHNNNNNNNNQPKRSRPSANERVLQELRSRTALRHSSMDPNNNIQEGQEVEVTRFEIHDRAYRPQSVYVFPFGEDSSDETLRTMIESVLQDSLIITACRPPLRLVSFDMEWVTDHRARKPRPTSLIQICGQTITLVIQLVHIQRPKWFLHVLPTPIAEFLRDPYIVKFGVGISGDADKLARDQFTDPTGSKVYLNAFLELIDVAKLVDPTARDDIPTDAFSLQRFVARYLEQFLSKTKSVVTSNWEAFYLSPTQLNYAASDVISAMRVYLKLYMLPAHHPRFMPPIRYAAPHTM